MKNLFLLFLGAFLVVSCSSPKYSYHFDHYDYNSGKKQTLAQTQATTTPEEISSPLVISKEALSADASTSAAPVATKDLNSIDKKAVAEKVSAMSKAERSALKKDLKAELKKYTKLKKTGDNGNTINGSKAMDHDLKLAAIFGAVGLVLTLFGGINTVFWVLGVIAFVIGVVFLIKWLARQ